MCFFSRRSFMGTKSNFGSAFSRRSFLQRSAAVGAGALSLESFLAACGSTPATTSGVATATVNTLPPPSNPGAVYLFNQMTKQFEQAYSNEKIVGKNDPYDPTTYLAKLAAGQAEDATESYFTEPQLLISKHALADITSLPGAGSTGAVIILALLRLPPMPRPGKSTASLSTVMPWASTTTARCSRRWGLIPISPLRPGLISAVMPKH